VGYRRNQALNIALCGFYGCGKTSAGWELAKRMRRQFIDVPQELVRKLRPALVRVPLWGRPPDPETAESRLVTELTNRRDLVIALSAESLDDDDALHEVAEFSYLVFIDVPFDVLYARLQSMPAHRDKLASLGRFGLLEQYERRRSRYMHCDLQLTGDAPPGRLAALILHCFYT
jgi:shikimate kinase